MEKIHITHALDSNVLAVASVSVHSNEPIDWAAYIGAVEGIKHTNESEGVAKNGSRLPEEVACLLFPQLKDIHWRK